MKTHNASLQERATWYNILGSYENSIRKLTEKLNKELKHAHCSQRGEICNKLQIHCDNAANVISDFRLQLGVIPKQ